MYIAHRPVPISSLLAPLQVKKSQYIPPSHPILFAPLSTCVVHIRVKISVPKNSNYEEPKNDIQVLRLSSIGLTFLAFLNHYLGSWRPGAAAVLLAVLGLLLLSTFNDKVCHQLDMIGWVPPGRESRDSLQV